MYKRITVDFSLALVPKQTLRLKKILRRLGQFNMAVEFPQPGVLQIDRRVGRHRRHHMEIGVIFLEV